MFQQAQPSFATTPSRRLLRNLIIGLAGLVIVSLFSNIYTSNAFGVVRQANPKSLSEARAQVSKAKKEADTAANAYAEAFGALSEVGDRLDEIQAQLEASETAMLELQKKAAQYARDAYIRSSTSKSQSDPQDIIDNNRRTQLLYTVAEFDNNQLAHLVGLKEDLAISKTELAVLQEDRRNRVNELNRQKKALETKLANATKAQKNLEARLARENRAAQNARRSSTNTSSSNSSGPGQILNPGSGSIACPIAGPVAFTNDWGRPRSGGRTHKGNDLFSPRGTPNVAVVDGTIFYQRERTGGLSAYVTGGGNTYYYTHLNAFAGSNRSVKRGEVIGYTGSTGNAAGGSPHTHFEIRVGGPNGNRVNPYATLRSVC